MAEYRVAVLGPCVILSRSAPAGGNRLRYLRGAVRGWRSRKSRRSPYGPAVAASPPSRAMTLHAHGRRSSVLAPGLLPWSLFLSAVRSEGDRAPVAGIG